MLFNTHFKSLLELPASGGVTSLSIVYYPEEVSIISPNSSSAALVPVITATEDQGRENPTIGSGELDRTTPADQTPQRTNSDRRSCDENCGGSSNSRLGTKTNRTEATSAAGVYVAVGLKSGAAEVMRLSCRRPRSRLFDLTVLATDQPSSSFLDMAPSLSSINDVDVVWSTGANELNFDPKSPEEHLHGDSFSRELLRDATAGANGDSNEMPIPLRSENGQRESGPAGSSDLPTEAAEPPALLSCDWRVPPDVDGSSQLSFFGRESPGVVIGLTPPANPSAATTTEPGGRSNANTPLSNTSSEMSRRAWGRVCEGKAREGGSGERSEGGGEGQGFALCMMDGRVGCCRLVSNTEGRPQWRVVWMRHTEASRGSLPLVLPF